MKQTIHRLKKPLQHTARVLRYRHIFVTGVLLFLVFFKAFWAPDILFFIFLSIFIIYGHGKDFIRKFAPFVILLLSYDALRGLVPFISNHVHFTEMVNFDLWLFGGRLPTVTLQHLWYNGTLHWFDYYFYFAYMLHFLMPFILAILIWKTRPGKYWQYIGALLALSYAGFITYIAFPAAPPWMASEHHIIPHIDKLSTLIWWGWGVHTIPTLYSHFNPNPVAAVPSLHAAYPMLDLLFVHKLFGRRISIPFLIYPVSVWLGVVYLGEHYVFDVLLGILYALGAFYASEYAVARGWHHKAINHARRAAPSWAYRKQRPAASLELTPKAPDA